MLKRYRLANLDHMVPMPDRGGRLFSQTPDGETIDTEHPFYLSMIADGDIVEATEESAPAATEKPAAEPRGKSKGK